MALSVEHHNVPAERTNGRLPVPLFRHEVVEYQQIEQQFGRVLLLQPLSTKITTWLIAASVALMLSLLFVGQYSRKVSVSGYLLPASGAAKIFPLQRGTVTKVHVTDGEEVREGQPLLTVDTAQLLATGEDVNAAILRTLSNQRDELDGRIRGEEQRMASEQERLALVIRGLQSETAQIEAQIPLQQERIKLADSLVASIRQLVAKGTVTDVELKRRQAEALDQKQNLNSLNQQLAAKRNQLTDSQYSLAQLPIATAEKVQLLRNELSNVEQKIAEATGRQAFVIRAPIEGRVSALQASPGKVTEPNQLQLEIIPSSFTLKADLFIPSRAVGFVRVGQRVSIRYDAFPYEHFGRYEGQIIEISKNILNTDDAAAAPIKLAEPAYKATVALDRQEIDAYGKHVPLQPGMLLKADVILDHRSLIRWLLDPLLTVTG
jgi:membrane fusion protein